MIIEMTANDACFDNEETYPQCESCEAVIYPGVLGFWRLDGEDNMFAICARCRPEYSPRGIGEPTLSKALKLATALSCELEAIFDSIPHNVISDEDGETSEVIIPHFLDFANQISVLSIKAYEIITELEKLS